MALRKYQKEICQALINKKDYAGSNVVIRTNDNMTMVWFYGNKIACTTARINAVKIAMAELSYG